MKQTIIKRLCLLLCLLLALTCCACGGDTQANQTDGGNTKLSFKQALSYDYLKGLDGKTVTINGYLATSSPVDGSFVFLMNMPFQSCPFCVPNTSQLSNTIEVYPTSGKTFSYTNQAVKVSGKLAVASDPGKPFTDPYGYTFAFKIVDATYSILSGEDLSAEMALWQKFSQTDLITEINRMYEYVNFVCSWNQYFVNSYEDAQGNTHPGYYLYASDALNYLKKENGQYHYGFAEGYFDKLIADIEKIDKTAFSELTENIAQAKALAEEAEKELELGHYTYEEQYVEKFGKTDYVYTITRGEELMARMDTLFTAFSNWLAGWEL